MSTEKIRIGAGGQCGQGSAAAVAAPAAACRSKRLDQPLQEAGLNGGGSKRRRQHALPQRQPGAAQGGHRQVEPSHGVGAAWGGGEDAAGLAKAAHKAKCCHHARLQQQWVQRKEGALSRRR